MSTTLTNGGGPHIHPSSLASSSTASPSFPLPYISLLESLKFKSTQIIDSILSLQRLIESNNQNALPIWPDILAKYTMLLSQTHSFSVSLARSETGGGGRGLGGASGLNIGGGGGAGALASNSLAKLALHPSVALTDAQLDNDLIPLLRNQQTTQVLRLESETVRRLSTRLNPAPSVPANPYTSTNSSPEVLVALLDQIKMEHDARCNRALRAVSLLRDKFDWKARVEVEAEEQDEFAVPISPLLASGIGSGVGAGGRGGGSPTRLSPMPTLTMLNGEGGVDVEMPDVNGNGDGDGDDDASMSSPDEDEEEDDEELEEVLGPSMDADTPIATTPLQLDEVGFGGGVAGQ